MWCHQPILCSQGLREGLQGPENPSGRGFLKTGEKNKLGSAILALGGWKNNTEMGPNVEFNQIHSIFKIP